MTVLTRLVSRKYTNQLNEYIEYCMNNPLIEEVKIIIEEKRKELSAQHQTAKLWNKEIDLIWITNMPIFAETTGYWALHLIAVQKMLPVFAGTGSNNYAKSGDCIYNY